MKIQPHNRLVLQQGNKKNLKLIIIALYTLIYTGTRISPESMFSPWIFQNLVITFSTYRQYLEDWQFFKLFFFKTPAVLYNIKLLPLPLLPRSNCKFSALSAIHFLLSKFWEFGVVWTKPYPQLIFFFPLIIFLITLHEESPFLSFLKVER